MNSPRDLCEGCVYQTPVGEYLICDYISITGHRRPCPFGEGCTVKQTEEGNTVGKTWDKAAALKLWQEGKTDPEIAEAVGVSAQTIKVWRRRNGRQPNSRNSKAKAEEVLSNPWPEPFPEPEAETVDTPDGDGRNGTEPDKDGLETSSGNLPAGPVELHVELCGGWARIRAPGWEQAAQLWKMLDVCISALTKGGEDG